ncbi:hypothetical protein CRYUN_Cryun10bG0140600 [Craigia yunnanensis]
MGIQLIELAHAKQMLQRSLSLRIRNMFETKNVPKGHIAVYVEEGSKRRFVISISYLNHPLFADLLNRAEEEFRFNHSMGGLTIPCSEAYFIIEYNSTTYQMVGMIFIRHQNIKGRGGDISENGLK